MKAGFPRPVRFSGLSPRTYLMFRIWSATPIRHCFYACICEREGKGTCWSHSKFTSVRNFRLFLSALPNMLNLSQKNTLLKFKSLKMIIYTYIESRDRDDDLHSCFIRCVHNTEMKKVRFRMHLSITRLLQNIHKQILGHLSLMCCWGMPGRIEVPASFIYCH